CATKWRSCPSNRYTKQNWPSQSRLALSAIMSNTGWASLGERLTTLSTSAVATCCSRASFNLRASRATSVSWRKAEELLLRAAFRALALRRAFGLPIALERRRIAHPKAKDYADFQSGITAPIYDRRNGVQDSVCTAAILGRACPLCAKSGHSPSCFAAWPKRGSDLCSVMNTGI